MLGDQFIAARSGKPPWSTMTLARTVRPIEPDSVRPEIFPDGFSDKYTRQWTTQASIILHNSTEEDMVEVIAKSDL